MTVNSFAPYARRGRCAATLALILVVGCETARTPLELARPSGRSAPPHVTSVISTGGGAADQAPGPVDALNEVSRRIHSAPGSHAERIQPVSFVEGHTARATLPSALETHPGPASSETADEDVALIDFGTEIRMPFGGPFTVTAYTVASRPTRISHVIRVTKTAGGRSYTSTFNDDSGFFNQPALYTTVGVSGDCGTFTTIVARTEHRAGSFTFGNEQGMSNADGSCGDSSETCKGEEGGGPDDVAVQGAGDDAAVASECTGGGPDAGGETTRYTCYTTVTDYYWYYPDTNTYEYRYSEETTWCEEAAA